MAGNIRPKTHRAKELEAQSSTQVQISGSQALGTMYISGLFGLNLLGINFPCLISRDRNGGCSFSCLRTVGNED